MTDADAKRILNATLEDHASCATGTECVQCGAVRHALRAMTDRRVLVEYSALAYVPHNPIEPRHNVFRDAVTAARRHMEGEE